MVIYTKRCLYVNKICMVKSATFPEGYKGSSPLRPLKTLNDV